MKRNWIASSVALVLALFVVSGCGTQFTVGEGFVTVDGLAAGQLVLCGANNEVLQITGSGFLSEHGNEVIVEFTALQGTPFNGQPSEQVVGIALSDGLVESLLPSVTGATELTVTIILPGSNFGVSPPETIQLGGSLVGPFANFDSFTDATGNVTYDVGAPGVLVNDTPSFCAEEDEEPREKPWLGDASRTLLLQNLSVAIPPAGFEDDATPGLLKMTTAMPASGERGTVLIQPDGSFVYEPPLGYEGADGFFYWVQETGRPDPSRAFVSITVSKVVWFIRDTALNPSVSLLGSGRFSDPFDSLASFNAVQNAPAVTNPFSFPPTLPIPPNPDNAPQEGDCIFIYENVLTTEYDEGIRLRDRQQLIGEGAGLFLNNTQIVPAGAGSNPNPTLTNSGISIGQATGILPVVTLGNENVVRGIDIDEAFESGIGYGDGIYGFDVSGPTFIDNVNIANAGFNGIHLLGESQFSDLQASTQAILGGTYQIGDPLSQTRGNVTIVGSGDNGIKIGESFFGSISQFAVNGLTVNVVATDILDSGFNGIEANDVNLNVTLTTIEGAETGINYTNNQFGQLCTLSVTNSNIGDSFVTPDPIRFRGIQITPIGGDIQANVSATSGRSEDTFLYGGIPFTGGRLDIVFDSNDFETIVTASEIPTVNLFGIDTTVMSMQDNTVVGNGTGEGMFFTDVTFDPGMGAVAGGDTDLGQGVATNQRVEGTALRFFNCSGALTFDTLDIFQLGGDLTGILNTGTLVINEGVKTIDVLP